MIVHLKFKIKTGDTYIHPVSLLSMSKLTEVIDDQDITTFRVNGFEVYESEYNRIEAMMTEMGCIG